MLKSSSLISNSPGIVKNSPYYTSSTQNLFFQKTPSKFTELQGSSYMQVKSFDKSNVKHQIGNKQESKQELKLNGPDFYHISQHHQDELNQKSSKLKLKVIQKENIRNNYEKIFTRQGEQKDDQYHIRVSSIFDRRFQNQKLTTSLSNQTSQTQLKTPQTKKVFEQNQFPELLKSQNSSKKSMSISSNSEIPKPSLTQLEKQRNAHRYEQVSNHSNQYGINFAPEFIETKTLFQKNNQMKFNNSQKKVINLSPIRRFDSLNEKHMLGLEQQLLNLSWITQKGSSSQQTKVNQDRLIVKRNVSNIENAYLLAVADGHGTNGHFVSKQIKKAIIQIFEFEDKRMAKTQLKLKNIDSIFDLLDNVEDGHQLFEIYIKLLLQKLFYSINKQIESQKQYDTQLSGSTLVVALVCKQYVVTANCGDSRCILVKDKDGEVLFETADHKPEKPEEKYRIEQQYKGKVRKLPQRFEAHIAEDPEQFEECAYRVWSPVLDLPGLAMSRSIGDGLAKTLGVIADPDISIKPFKKEDNILGIILASDGIWDVIKSQELGKMIVMHGKSYGPKEFVSRVLNEANRRWMKQPQNLMEKKANLDIDDITLIFGMFNKEE
ncbi:protein phosphatase 2c containing protein [Stylonychia lemnae]|uniref:Protein phosphatase 2c containing protein n=1 Tax=Stylonychia lemnae TaxID=5949 RepID=A0A078A3E0_STYLE|nr:protein phosphatase 2c containing protein [Stylonychia lemnae]|eukprot:CDW75279.1 protein phosphatase 2c containing protein [Stylonychia lemnae]